MLKAEKSGCRPINRLRSWDDNQRQTKKEHTPGGQMAKLMRQKEAQNKQGRKIRFKIIEIGGVTLDQKLRRSDPLSGGKCGRPRCFPCMGEKGVNCWREGVTYSLWCEQCGEKVACYKGETGRNSYTQSSTTKAKWT